MKSFCFSIFFLSISFCLSVSFTSPFDLLDAEVELLGLPCIEFPSSSPSPSPLTSDLPLLPFGVSSPSPSLPLPLPLPFSSPSVEFSSSSSPPLCFSFPFAFASQLFRISLKISKDTSNASSVVVIRPMLFKSAIFEIFLNPFNASSLVDFDCRFIKRNI